MAKLFLNNKNIKPILFNAKSSHNPTSKYEIVDGVLTAKSFIDSFSNITQINEYALNGIFYCNPNLTGTLDFSNLITVKDFGLSDTFYGCSKITSVDFSNLITIGNSGLSNIFYGCSKLNSVDFSNLTTVGNFGLSMAFWFCKLTSISFPNLVTINSEAFYFCFAGNPLKHIYFNSLNLNSFGNYKNQFNYMLSGITGCTIHFPSNLESIIQTFQGYPNFAGTSTVILFDLPATT